MKKLHAIAQSGNAYKVALMLRLLKQPFESVYVHLFGGQTREPAWRAAHNAQGEVPVLKQAIQKLPGWAGPYDLLPGERIAPKWVKASDPRA